MRHVNVWVEIGETGEPIRIFRKAKAAIAAMLEGRQVEDKWPRHWAVYFIRRQVIDRAKNACDRCGAVVGDELGEMHETLPRGKGGEISLDNCEWLCHDCHQGDPDSAHGDRRWGGRVNDSTVPARSVQP